MSGPASKLGIFLKRNEDLSTVADAFQPSVLKETRCHSQRTEDDIRRLGLQLPSMNSTPSSATQSSQGKHRRINSSHTATPNKLVNSQLFETDFSRHKPTKSTQNASSCIEIAGANTPHHSERNSVSPPTTKVRANRGSAFLQDAQTMQGHKDLIQTSNPSAREKLVDFTQKKSSWVMERSQHSNTKARRSERKLLDPEVLMAVRRNARAAPEEISSSSKKNIPVTIPERETSAKKQPVFAKVGPKKVTTASANLTPTKPRNRAQQHLSQKQLMDASVGDPTQREIDSMSQRQFNGIWTQSAQVSKRRLDSFHQPNLSARRSDSHKSKSQSIYPELHMEEDEAALLLRTRMAELVKLKKTLAQMSAEKNTLEREMLEMSHSKQAVLYELEESRQHAKELQQIIELRNSELNKMAGQLETMQRLLDRQTTQNPARVFGNRGSSDMSSTPGHMGGSSYHLDLPEYGIAIIEESCGEESDRSELSPRRTRGVFDSSDAFNIAVKQGKTANSIRRKLKELFSTRKKPNIDWVEQLLEIVAQDPKLRPPEIVVKAAPWGSSGAPSRQHSGETSPLGGESAVAEFEDDFTEEDFSVYQRSKKLFCPANPFTPSRPSTPRSTQNLPELAPPEQHPVPVSNTHGPNQGALTASLAVLLLQILQHKYFENESLYGLTRWLQSQIKRYKMKLRDCKTRQREADRMLLTYQQVLLESNSDLGGSPTPEFLISSKGSVASLNGTGVFPPNSPHESFERTVGNSARKTEADLMTIDEEPVMGTSYMGDIEWHNDDTIIYQ